MMWGFENEIFKDEHRNVPSDSESGMQPHYREPCARSSNPPDQDEYCVKQLPLAGLIYMCDNRTRRIISRTKIIRMQPGRNLLQVQPARLRPGIKLFIFEFERRLLWGIFEITTFPHFQRRGIARSQEMNSFYQIRFQVYQMFGPLEEEVFKYAIEENYYTPCKFNFLLSKDQVADLQALFGLANANYSRTPHQFVRPQKAHRTRFQAVDHKLSGFDHDVVSSCMHESRYRRSVRRRKHVVQLDSSRLKPHAELVTVDSTSKVELKRSGSEREELLHCNLNFGGASDSFPEVASITASFPKHCEQEDEASSTCTATSLEEGEFVFPEDDKASVKNKEYRFELQQSNETASVEVIESGDCDREFRTRNFLEILEHSLSSDVSKTRATTSSRFLTTSDGGRAESNRFDKVNIPAQSQVTGVNDNKACEGAVMAANTPKGDCELRLVSSFDKANSQHGQLHTFVGKNKYEPLSRPPQKHTKSLQRVCSTDGGNKVRGSVWLRLADPRPMKADHFFRDVDGLEQEKS